MVSVIIPTYNEKCNVARLANRILKIPGADVIIVDDNSPDGTGDIADDFAKKHKGRVHVIHRKGKLGIGSAHIEGFGYALKLGSDIIITMDADFSHDPKYIPRLSAATKHYDVVVGSRYVSGGGVSWKWHRRLISRGANAFSRIMLGLKVSDMTSGYRCYTKAALESLDFRKIKSDGFSFLEEMLYRCKQKGFRIGEIPIFFMDRREGKSKLNKIEMAKFFLTILRLRLVFWR